MAGLPIFLPDPDLYPDPSGRASKVCTFISRLKLWEGDFAGENLKVNPFQEAITRRIYGPSTDDGRMLVRHASIWLPRGNAKTTLASAYAICHFMGPLAQPGGQVVAAAADRGNAGIAFNSSFQMIRQDPVLWDRIRPIESQKFMSHPGTKGTFKAISTEAYSKHGLNVSFFLADEIHAWPPTEARKLWKVITDSMVKRSSPLTISISTAGEGAGGLAWDQWDYAHKVAMGEIDDPTHAAIIFAAPPGADWRDERSWYFANPGIAAGFLSIEELRIKAKRIQHFPGEISDFQRFHLNEWVEGASQPWIALTQYDRAKPKTDDADLEGSLAYIGIDLASVEDLAAVVTVFPDAPGDDRGFDIKAMFFLPEEALAKKADLDRADYLRWVQDGWLTVTEGNRIDYKKIIAYVRKEHELFSVKGVAIDRWNSTSMVTTLQEENMNVIEYGQGFVSMAAPCKEIKQAILGCNFRHGNNRLLRMCFGNVVAVMDDAGNEKFTKAKSRGRIDGATAAANAIGLILKDEAEDDTYRGAFTKPRAKVEADEEPDDGTWSEAVLQDMRHPLFELHKARFERWQDKQNAEEGVW